MRRNDAQVQRVLLDLVQQFDASDPRIVRFVDSANDQGVSEFASALLSDRTIAPQLARRVLWLLPLFPTATFIDEALRAMVDRPELARFVGRELGKLKDPSTIPALGKVLLEPGQLPEVRMEAAGALGEIGDPGAKPYLVRALDAYSAEPILLREIASGLGYIQLCEGSTDTSERLCQLLDSSVPDVRMAALNALANMVATEALDRIEALLDDQGVTESGERVAGRAAQVVSVLRS